MTQKYPSTFLDNAVNEFAKLSGIGKKSALRLALQTLKRTKEEVSVFCQAISDLSNSCYASS
jgi:recombination protein RecR